VATTDYANFMSRLQSVSYSAPVALYFVDIRLDHLTIPGVRVIASATEEFTLLGRDVLNKLSLFLDGPQQQAEILDDEVANRLRARRG